MFTLAEFAAALPSALSLALPTAVIPDDGMMLMQQLAGDSQDACFTINGGIWFCCGNEDAYFPYDGPHTAVEAATALGTMYTAWGVQYNHATGFSA